MVELAAGIVAQNKLSSVLVQRAAGKMNTEP